MRAFLAVSLLSLPVAATQYHVDADAAPGGDGLSWATAFDELDDATPLLVAGDEIWLAEGTYVPRLEQTPGDPRSVTFLLPAGVKLYGGFAGNETSLVRRAGLFDTTVLDGELGQAGHADNAYHVLTVLHPSGIPPGGNVVDGLRVRRGNADGASNGQGGGVRAFNVGLRLERVTIEDNRATWGAGVHAQPGLLHLVRCTLRNNVAASNGGGLWGQSVNVKAFNTRFERNRALVKGGGAYLHSSSNSPEFMLFAGCVFFENGAESGGGAFVGGGQFSFGDVTFRHCTFARNRAALRGGGVCANTDPQLPALVDVHDSILWSNWAPLEPNVGGRVELKHSNVQFGAVNLTLGNINSEPGFVELDAGDLRLAPGSPCIDAGDNAAVAKDFVDLDGDGITAEPVDLDAADRRRRVDDPATPDSGSGGAPLVDMGAYEYAP